MNLEHLIQEQTYIKWNEWKIRDSLGYFQLIFQGFQQNLKTEVPKMILTRNKICDQRIYSSIPYNSSCIPTAFSWPMTLEENGTHAAEDNIQDTGPQGPNFWKRCVWFNTQIYIS